MKKLILASAIALAPIASYADTGPGCGLGATLWEGKEGLVANVLAATTNGSSGNQTFGMTFGSLGCDGEGLVTISAADKFLDSNIDKIARDMSTGNGESLATLAWLLGVSEKDHETFFKVTQSNFTTIFDADDVNSQQVLVSLKSVMQNDITLSKYLL